MGISISGGGFPPAAFQKAMVFIDGTNLFHRLQSAKLKVSRLWSLFESSVGGRQIARAYLYTIRQYLDKAREVHGEHFCDGIRIIYGDGVPTKDGNIKEKGVDALLVADMIYHAASRNCEYALVVTVDTDFVHVLRRVEDFGCRTGLLSVCCEAPAKLVDACDDYYQVDADLLTKQSIAIRVS